MDHLTTKVVITTVTKDNTAKEEEYDNDTETELPALKLQKTSKKAPVKSKKMNMQSKSINEEDELEEIVRYLQTRSKTKRAYKRKMQDKEACKSTPQKQIHIGNGDLNDFIKSEPSASSDSRKNNGIGKKTASSNQTLIESQIPHSTASSQTSVKAIPDEKTGPSKSRPKKKLNATKIEAKTTKKATPKLNLMNFNHQEVEQKPLPIQPLQTIESDDDVIFERIVTRGYKKLCETTYNNDNVMAIIDLTNSNAVVQENSVDTKMVLVKTEPVAEIRDEISNLEDMEVVEPQLKIEPTLVKNEITTPAMEQNEIKWDTTRTIPIVEDDGEIPENDIHIINLIDEKTSKEIDKEFKTTLDRILTHLVSLKLSEVDVNIRMLTIYKILATQPLRPCQLMTTLNGHNHYLNAGVVKGCHVTTLLVNGNHYHGSGCSKGKAKAVACQSALESLFGIYLDKNFHLINILPKTEKLISYAKSFGVRSSLVAIKGCPAGVFIPLSNIRDIAGDIISNANEAMTMSKSKASNDMLINTISQAILQKATRIIPKANGNELSQFTRRNNNQHIAAIMNPFSQDANVNSFEGPYNSFHF